MKERKKHRSILVLMTASQLLLTLFVIYWLRSQYITEKERLLHELLGLYIDTQDEIVDTLLFKSYVNPVLTGKDRFINITDSVVTDSVFAAKETEDVIRWKGLQGSITVRMENHGDSSAMPDTIKIRKINDEMLLRSVKLIVSHSRDSMNRKGPPVVRNFMMKPDTSVFKRHFHNRLDESGLKFNITWKTSDHKDTARLKRVLYLDPVGPFSLPAISVSAYGSYLTGKILPQIIFGFALIVITALAFLISYRSIRNHIILNSMRNEFINNITHELKTPVSTISVALESLAKYNIRNDPEVMDEYLKIAVSENKRLEELINRVLDHSLLEVNKHPLNLISTDLNMLITEVVDVMKQKIEKSGKIEFRASEQEINVLCDPLYLKGVISNLIDNSIKYCNREPFIRILAGKAEGFAVIEVTDNGPGIPAEYREKIFEKFFRLPSGDVHNVKGYGLGLSFASLVMKLHNGSIEVKNCDDGCTFVLKIPVA
jgi:signal transduction histidine kinase